MLKLVNLLDFFALCEAATATVELLPDLTFGSVLMVTVGVLLTAAAGATSVESPLWLSVPIDPPNALLYFCVSIRTQLSRLSIVVSRWKRGSSSAALVSVSFAIICDCNTLAIVRLMFIIRGSSCSAIPSFLINIFEVMGDNMLHSGMSSPRNVSNAI